MIYKDGYEDFVKEILLRDFFADYHLLKNGVLMKGEIAGLSERCIDALETSFKFPYNNSFNNN